MWQVNFTGNVAQQATFFFITEEAKEIALDFSQGTVLLISFFALKWNDSI